MTEINTNSVQTMIANAAGILTFIMFLKTNRARYLRYTRLLAILCIALQLIALLAGDSRPASAFNIFMTSFTLIFTAICITIDYVWKGRLMLLFANCSSIVNYSLVVLMPLKSAAASSPVFTAVHLISLAFIYLILHFSFLLALFYLISERGLRNKSFNYFVNHTPSLVLTKRLMTAATTAGVILLTAAILSSYNHAEAIFKTNEWRWDIRLWLMSISWLSYTVFTILNFTKKIRFTSYSWGVIASFAVLFVSQFTHALGDFHSRL